MKKALLTAALTMLSASAFAGVNLGTRIDYLNNAKYTNDANTDVGATSYFTPSVVRLNFNSKVGDATVNGSLNLLGNSSPGAGAWNAYSVIDYLELTKTFGDMSVTVGRLINPAGGFDDVTTLEGNQYLATVATAGDISHFAAGTAVVVTPYNQNGGALGYKLGDHAFRFDVTNESNYVAGTAVKKRNNMGLAYDGMFADKMVAVKAGYISGAADTSAAGVITQYNQTFMNLGAKVNVADFGITAEYLNNSQKAATDGAKANTANSIYAQVEYKAGAYKPLAKIESSEVKVAEDASVAGSFKRTATTVGVEITPKAGDDFRYHVAYSAVADKVGLASAANSTVNWSQLVAGIKFSSDLLK